MPCPASLVLVSGRGPDVAVGTVPGLAHVGVRFGHAMNLVRAVRCPRRPDGPLTLWSYKALWNGTYRAAHLRSPGCSGGAVESGAHSLAPSLGHGRRAGRAPR